MILYFNDYKLIYIITMMGKINNIPVLNEDVIRLVVLNDTVLSFKTIPIILVILRKTIIFAHSDA